MRRPVEPISERRFMPVLAWKPGGTGAPPSVACCFPGDVASSFCSPRLLMLLLLLLLLLLPLPLPNDPVRARPVNAGRVLGENVIGGT